LSCHVTVRLDYDLGDGIIASRLPIADQVRSGS
jgi:hypothetical protein